MGIRECEDCGGKVSDLAESCPHCGRPMEPKSSDKAEEGKPPEEEQALEDEKAHGIEPASPTDETKGENGWSKYKYALGVIGFILIIVSLFLPLVKAPNGATSTFFGTKGSLGGAFILLWALISIGFAQYKRFKYMVIPAAFVLGIALFTLNYTINSEYDLSMEFGWYVVFAGCAALILGAFIPGPEEQKRRGVFLEIICVPMGLVTAFFIYSNFLSPSDSASGVSQTRDQRFGAAGPASPVESGECIISDLRLSNIPERKSDGRAWDPMGGRPDVLVRLTVGGRVFTTGASENAYTDASWHPGWSIELNELTVLKLEVEDEDLTAHDNIAYGELDASKLSWGNNRFEASNGLTIIIGIE